MNRSESGAWPRRCSSANAAVMAKFHRADRNPVSMTRSFAGIRPEDVGGFVIAQLLGALVGLGLAIVLTNGNKEPPEQRS